MVIDTEVRPKEEDLAALAEGCDLLVIPTTPDVLSLDAVILTVSAIKEKGDNRYQTLLTIIPPKPSRDGDEARAVLREAKMPMFASGIRRYVAFQKAALAGVPVYDVRDPRASEGWKDYLAVGKEIVA